MPLIEIILFASIAAFFAFRLYLVLGRRTGHQPSPDAATRTPSPGAEANPAGLRPAFTGPAAAGMEAIRAADGVFEPDMFVAGARAAYEAIVTAYAEGDRETLQALLAPKVFEKWARAIDEREAAGRRQVSDLVRIDRSEIEAARLDNRRAGVDVRFEASLSSGQVDADGATVEGDPTRISRVAEIWTFERDIDSPDPNWSLARVKQG